MVSTNGLPVGPNGKPGSGYWGRSGTVHGKGGINPIIVSPRIIIRIAQGVIMTAEAILAALLLFEKKLSTIPIIKRISNMRKPIIACPPS
jgi:hypothetical protein